MDRRDQGTRQAPDADKVLPTPDRFTEVNEHLRVKEVTMVTTTCESAVTHLAAELYRIATARARAPTSSEKVTSDTQTKRLQA